MRIQAASVLIFALMSVAVYAQKADVQSDPAAPFATFKTYAWTAGTPASNPFAEEQIHAAVNAQLAEKGMTESASAPDVIVATHVATHEKQEVVANGFGFGPWWGYGPAATVETYVKGTLIVDLYDARTKKMVWRGVATTTVSDKPSKNTEKIDKAVEHMFEKYPPL
jgi:hypothetical protein